MRESGNWKGAVYGSFIFIPASKVVVTEKDQKKVVKDSFSVSAITISADKVITGISVINQKKAEVFRWGNLNAAEKNNGDANEEWQELYRELERTKVPEEQILKRYGVKALSELDEVSKEKSTEWTENEQNQPPDYGAADREAGNCRYGMTQHLVMSDPRKKMYGSQKYRCGATKSKK